MAKLQSLCTALFLLCLLFAAATEQAWAAPVWLVEGNELSEDLPAETEGLLLFVILTSEGGVLYEVDCSAIWDGSIAPAGEGTIEKLLNLAKEEISSTPLSGLALECKNTDPGNLDACRETSETSVWPLHLPWHTQLESMAGPPEQVLDRILAHTGGEPPGYETQCTSLLGISSSDECTGATSSKVATEILTFPESTLDSFNYTEPISSELGNCTKAGTNTFALTGELNTWAIGGTLGSPKDLEHLATRFV
jgi:hypothetical protein